MTAVHYPWTSALVTGASAGIGLAMAELLGAAGVPTVVVARRADRLTELARRLPSLEPLAADLLRPEGLAAVTARLTDPARPVELLVNNAGFGVAGDVADARPERLQDMIELNIGVLTSLTRSALDPMVHRRRGWILQVSSVAGFQPGPGSAVYSATKAYVTSFSEALAAELRDTGVVVTALCPGFTRTEFHEVSGSAGEADRVPAFAWMSAHSVAAAGLAAMAVGRPLEVPGAPYKVVSALSNVLPRRAVRMATRFLR